MGRSLLLLPVLSLLVLTALGCTSKTTDDPSNPPTEVVAPLPVKPVNTDQAKPEDKSAVVRDSNQFALDLFRRLDSKDNLFLSPASISTALAMTYAGARGQTAEQMAKVLHFNLDAKRLHPAFGAFLWEMQGEGKQQGYRLNIANALWGHKDSHFLPDFLQLMKDNYSAGMQQVDFTQPDDARREINAWAAQQTGDKIKDLLHPGDVSPETRLVLTNAIYFKSDWRHAFIAGATHSQNFHVAPGKDVVVPMMRQMSEFRTYTDKNRSFKLLEMPYDNSELSMIVLLPAQVDGLAQLEKKLDAGSLTEWLQQMKAGKTLVLLPKFTMRRRFELADLLQKMGMTAAFRAGEADFSGMTNDKPGMFLSAVIHEAKVEVNEKGTEAAAATAVTTREKSPMPPVFQADHPFLFLIRDMRSGSILFLGRMNNPKN